nr:MAG TPA: hypothetical protein [Caudoviricetes sp.]
MTISTKSNFVKESGESWLTYHSLSLTNFTCAVYSEIYNQQKCWIAIGC